MLYEVITIHKRKLQKMASLAAENVRLRQLLNSSDTMQDRVIIAELIGVSPDPLVQTVMINRGVITSYSIHYTKLYES